MFIGILENRRVIGTVSVTFSLTEETKTRDDVKIAKGNQDPVAQVSI